VSGRLLTAREVAEWFGVAVETVLRWSRRGVLPGFPLPGGMVRFDEDELKVWLERGARRPEECLLPAATAPTWKATRRYDPSRLLPEPRRTPRCHRYSAATRASCRPAAGSFATTTPTASG
jgi:excisionase family DNA binding protein